MKLVAIVLGAITLAACGDPSPASPAEPATLARVLSSAFGHVPGQPSPPFLLTAPLVDMPALCGPKGKDFGTQRLAFHEVEVTEVKGVEEYTVKAKGRCRIDGANGYRPASGRFRLVLKPGYVETKAPTRRDPSSRGFFIWSLQEYALLEADAPGAWVEEQPKPPRPHCPASVAEAASQFAQCDPRNRTICWFDEMGCQCTMMGLPWKCGMGRCPTPRPEAGAPCKEPLVRCLPEKAADGSSGGATLTCVSGRWTEAPATP